MKIVGRTVRPLFVSRRQPQRRMQARPHCQRQEHILLDETTSELLFVFGFLFLVVPTSVLPLTIVLDFIVALTLIVPDNPKKPAVFKTWNAEQIKLFISGTNLDDIASVQRLHLIPAVDVECETQAIVDHV